MAVLLVDMALEITEVVEVDTALEITVVVEVDTALEIMEVADMEAQDMEVALVDMQAMLVVTEVGSTVTVVQQLVVVSILASTIMQQLADIAVTEVTIMPATQLEVLVAMVPLVGTIPPTPMVLATTTVEVVAMQPSVEALAVSAVVILALLAAASPEM